MPLASARVVTSGIRACRAAVLAVSANGLQQRPLAKHTAVCNVTVMLLTRDDRIFHVLAGQVIAPTRRCLLAVPSPSAKSATRMQGSGRRSTSQRTLATTTSRMSRWVPRASGLPRPVRAAAYWLVSRSLDALHADWVSNHANADHRPSGFAAAGPSSASAFVGIQLPRASRRRQAADSSAMSIGPELVDSTELGAFRCPADHTFGREHSWADCLTFSPLPAM